MVVAKLMLIMASSADCRTNKNSFNLSGVSSGVKTEDKGGVLQTLIR